MVKCKDKLYFSAKIFVSLTRINISLVVAVAEGIIMDNVSYY